MKCYNCRKDKESDTAIFCEDCEKKQIEGTLDTKGSSTLVIYHTV